MSARARLGVVLGAVLLAACTTPPEVRELASKTAANVGILSAQAKRVGQESRALAEIRSANISQLHAANVRLRASYNYDVELTKKASGASNLKLIESIKRWGKRVAGIFEAARTAEAERKAAILETQKTLDTKSEALSAIAKSLASLAREQGMKDRVRFMAGFAREVRKEMDGQLEKGGESASAAKALLSEIKH